MLFSPYITPHGPPHDSPIIIFVRNRFLSILRYTNINALELQRESGGYVLLAIGQETQQSEFLLFFIKKNNNLQLAACLVTVGALEGRTITALKQMVQC